MGFERSEAVEWLEGGEYLSEMRYRGERSHVAEIYCVKDVHCPFEDVEYCEVMGLESEPCQCHPYAAMPLSENYTEADEAFWLSNVGHPSQVFVPEKQAVIISKHDRFWQNYGRGNQVIR